MHHNRVQIKDFKNRADTQITAGSDPIIVR